ncbi:MULTISPECIES: hypothetical protein [unclassified Mesorhizobium]|uniref:hypothetical protein n=1 Tax=unclassified Mesorhizobium TaxID=325217 RepID=UPI0011284458|nr:MULTISPECIES: hypothetical protein [unclassified Mesorhizobium]TPK42281.1 hypothetical protein FJ550_30055 [Mesorhizobium sp. B2-5-2]TPL44524.1 hypothetical protein FJ961_04085 [Mesorhizobium sp. B2-4-5]TPM68711.1 hypothetical protein FJ968_29890 [Mesorhizobium sp. B2-1-6]TPN71729.1 hypothetical protein FJ985_30560 [Mesorhizobium sp. B1-1-2]
MTEASQAKHPHYVLRAVARLHGGLTLVRQASATEEAVERGDGHVYFTHPDGRQFPTASGAYCVKNGLVKPVGDDLFGTGSQTYRVA